MRGLEWKIKEVEDLKNAIRDHKVVGLVGMEDLPSKQLQEVRNRLRGKIKIKMKKNNLIRRSLEGFDGIEEMSKNISGQTALIFSDIDIFKLFKLLESSKSKAPLKPGDRTPKDVVVKKGSTSFKPGPIVGELQRSGIPSGIEGGKVVIREDKVVLREGETVSPKLSEVLNILEVYPKEIGLDLKTIFGDERIFDRSDLVIDLEEYEENLLDAVKNAYNLAFNVAYPSPEILPNLIGKAVQDARNLAFNANIYEKGTMDLLIGKAYSQMIFLATKILGVGRDALDEDTMNLLK